VVDAETSIKNRGPQAVGDMAASPYCADNKIVLLGERQAAKNRIYGPQSGMGLRKERTPEFLMTAQRESVLLIGQNICFDLKYIAKTYPSLWEDALPNIFIWDTQQVAYLLSGQTHMYPSLDELCEEIGQPLKDDKIKEYWENGVDTELIPMGELVPYLEGDLENTEAVFRYQYNLVKDNHALFTLIKVKMDDLLCTNMMEENGMQFDLVVAQSYAANNDMRIAINETFARSFAAPHFAHQFEFNPMSNEHVSLVLFGGKYKLREAVPVMDVMTGAAASYKTGKRAGMVKTKLVDVEYTTKGFGITPTGEPNARGYYPVGEEVLKKLDGLDFARVILAIRELTKENETYYRGYSQLVWPDGRIHPSINHCSTRTGRQSCNKPNLQNVTRD